MGLIIALWAFIIVFSYFLLGFIIAQIKKDNSIADILWGLGFVILAVTLYFMGEKTLPSLAVTLCVVVWGLRLFLYIGIRNWNKGEDYRYIDMREKWGKKQLINAFFKVFMIQGFFQYLIAMSIIAVNAYPIIDQSYLGLGALLIGLLIWCKGFFFEAVGDAQLKRFRSDPSNKGKILQSGLWKYTRHPNYFGEVTMWWGLFVIVVFNTTPMGLIALISPLTITWLILKVSGIPLLEAKFKDNPLFIEYAKKTNKFIPWFPKKST